MPRALSRTHGLTVLLVAEESAGLRVLRLLAEKRHRVAAVLTTLKEGSAGAIAATARGLELEVMPSERVCDPTLAAEVSEREVDLLLNVHSLFVVHGDVVRAPRIGSFNLHPGPLPEYAGLNAPSWAIANGESRHAATVHWMEAGIDTGAIAYKAEFDITEADTGLSVSIKCIEHGISLVERLLEDAAVGHEAIPIEPQDLSRRRYYGREAPDGGRLRWDRPARRVVDFVRACDYTPFASPWGRPRSRLGDREIEVVKAARTGDTTTAQPGLIGPVDEAGALVAAEDEWVLVQSVAEGGEPPVSPLSLLPEGARLRD